jgi:hypothetical protein
VNPTPTPNLDALLSAIQDKWGQQALQPLAHVRPHGAFLPTAWPALDAALGAGGIPRNRLTTLSGQPTSGMTTLAYTLMAQAQQHQLIPVYLDAPHTFDPEYAAYRGVDLEMLLIIRPETWEHALELLRDVIHITVAGLLVLDANLPDLPSSRKHTALASTLHRVGTILPQSTWTVVALIPPELPAQADHSATVRLLLQRLGWWFEDDLLRGYQVQITVLKNKGGPVGEPVIMKLALRGSPQ